MLPVRNFTTGMTRWPSGDEWCGVNGREQPSATTFRAGQTVEGGRMRGIARAERSVRGKHFDDCIQGCLEYASRQLTV